MVYAKQQLNEHLPAELLARVEESLADETDDGHKRVVYPDLSNQAIQYFARFAIITSEIVSMDLDGFNQS